MSLTFIIVIAVIFLLLIGATQRKRLLLLFRAETNAAIKNATNNEKVLDLKLQQFKDAVNKLIDAAGSVYAQILKTEKELKKAGEDEDRYRKEAKDAKEKGETEIAKTKLEAMLYSKSAKDQYEKDLKDLVERKKKLEISIIRMKTRMNTYSCQIEALKGRNAVNKALKSINGVNALDGESLVESIELFDGKTEFENNKLTYIDGEQTPDFSSEVSSEFDKL